MMRGMRRGILVAAAVAFAGVARAAEPDPAEPSVCSPPCAEGETCDGNTCVGPGGRRPERPAAPQRPPEAEAPYGSAPIGAPQREPVPRSAPAQFSSPPPAAASVPPPPAPSPPAAAALAAPAARAASSATREPAAVYASAPGARRKRHLLAIPYVGVHSYVQRDAYGPGLRFGGLLGVRVGDRLSVNGELTYDVSNVSGPITLEQERFFRGSVSPLVHVDARGLELGIGPKVGIYSRRSRYDAGGADLEITGSGYSTGINAGAFVPVSPQVSIGVLLSFEVMWARPDCYATAFGSPVQPCGSTTDVGKLLGLTGGLLF